MFDAIHEAAILQAAMSLYIATLNDKPTMTPAESIITRYACVQNAVAMMAEIQSAGEPRRSSAHAAE